jgi:hypothetical protein
MLQVYVIKNKSFLLKQRRVQDILNRERITNDYKTYVLFTLQI